jgi:glyoxylase-like metal-dependent hydrolase (beta-lactamase superfamily II)
MEPSRELLPDLHLLSTYVPVPTIGLLPVNAFLVKGKHPYLVDTGLLSEADELQRQVEALIDPADLRWIYLTHSDPDHIGALLPLLDRAPRAKVITSFVAVAKLQLGLRPLPPDRVLLLNPGERLDLGDRTLTVMRPPLFDAPETTMVYDGRLNTLFSADSFGGPLSAPTAQANDLPPDQLEASQRLWATVDAPWIHDIDRKRFATQLGRIDDLNPALLLSAHLPPAQRMAKALCRNLAKAPETAPFAAPDQPAFEAILRAAAAAPPR